MAAIVGLLMAKLKSGDEVIFFNECYHRSREFCSKHLSRFGVVTRQVEACNYEAMADAINANTKMLISESPTNPHLSCVDLERFAELGRKHAGGNADRRHVGDALTTCSRSSMGSITCCIRPPSIWVDTTICWPA